MCKRIGIFCCCCGLFYGRIRTVSQCATFGKPGNEDNDLVCGVVKNLERSFFPCPKCEDAGHFPFSRRPCRRFNWEEINNNVFLVIDWDTGRISECCNTGGGTGFKQLLFKDID